MEENQEEGSPKTQTGPKHIWPRWQCPECGTRIMVSNKKRHLNTKKHKDAKYVLTEKFEVL